MSNKALLQRTNTSVSNEVSEYNSLFSDTASVELRENQYRTLVQNYYSIATDFYEYGWGQSFHFANRYRNETLFESLQRHESFLALKMHVQPGEQVLDLGCGVGGPLRRIAYLSGAHITGVTISEYQIQRAKKIGTPRNCKFIQADFMALPFEENSFDHIYSIEAVCHAPDRSKCFSEALRVLKPGGSFVCYDWCLTDKYDPQNVEHVKIRRLVEEGDALPELRPTQHTVDSLKIAGFEVEQAFIVPEGDVPWYQPLNGGDSFYSFDNFRTTSAGRALTRNFVWFLEKIHLAAKGSLAALAILETAREGLVKAGELDIFTPYFFFLARKPLLNK